jgi:hypothetical protein
LVWRLIVLRQRGVMMVFVPVLVSVSSLCIVGRMNETGASTSSSEVLLALGLGLWLSAVVLWLVHRVLCSVYGTDFWKASADSLPQRCVDTSADIAAGLRQSSSTSAQSHGVAMLVAMAVHTVVGVALAAAVSTPVANGCFVGLIATAVIVSYDGVVVANVAPLRLLGLALLVAGMVLSGVYRAMILLAIVSVGVILLAITHVALSDMCSCWRVRLGLLEDPDEGQRHPGQRDSIAVPVQPHTPAAVTDV